MAVKVTPGFFLYIICCSLVSIIIMAQERAPHGLLSQNPVAFSPSAYDFFHPSAHQDECVTSECSPFPVTAAQLQETSTSREGSTATTPEPSLLSGGGVPAAMAPCPILTLLTLIILSVVISYCVA